MVEQKINARKTDEGYYVEVLHDDKIIWTDTFKSEEELNRFIEDCNKKTFEGCPIYSQEEGRKRLESGELTVEVFYRNPVGDWYATIDNHDALPMFNARGFEVWFINKDDVEENRTVPTIDEAFQLIKDVEDGKV